VVQALGQTLAPSARRTGLDLVRSDAQQNIGGIEIVGDHDSLEFEDRCFHRDQILSLVLGRWAQDIDVSRRI
jgi:hypothetical protein